MDVGGILNLENEKSEVSRILVVSGFLGCGKTTFIERMYDMTKRRIAIMENEYGEANVDSAVLKDDTPDANIWEITEGCICCSRKKDLAASVLTAVNAISPDILVIECTGVAILSNIMAELMKIEYDRIRILKPITIVETGSFNSNLIQFGNVFIEQIETAGTIVLSKCESISSGERAEIIEKIRRINSEAEITDEHYSVKREDWWESLFENFMNPHVKITPNTTVQDREFKAVKIDMQFRSIGELVYFCNDCTMGKYGSVIRGKGYVLIQGEWFRFDVAGGRYSITGISTQEKEDIVLISISYRRKITPKLLVN